MPTVQRTYRLSPENDARLVALAERAGKTPAELVQTLIKTTLDKNLGDAPPPASEAVSASRKGVLVRLGGRDAALVSSKAAAARVEIKEWMRAVVLTAARSTETVATGVGRGGKQRRVTVRLPESVASEARRLAESEGRSLPSWVVNTVAASLRLAVPFNAAELAELREGLREVARVGRNLNTLLHVLHRTGRWEGDAAVVKDVQLAVQRAVDRLLELRERALERYGYSHED